MRGKRGRGCIDLGGGKEGGGAAEVMVCGVGYLRVWEVDDLFVERGRWWGTCCGMEDGEKETEETK